MSDDAQSKRARQKQRRDAKLAEQRQQQARARRNRILMFSLVGLLVVALIGLGVYRVIDNRNKAKAREARVANQLEELGCTEDAEVTSLGGGHIESTEELRASPPEALYADRPTASGQHHPAVVKSGFYDVQVDERLLVHNLEHGYVNIWYDDGLPEEQLGELETFVTESIDGAFPKLIAVPFDGDLPEDKNVVFTAWTFKQSCEDFDREVLEVFGGKHHSGNGVAPEKTAAPHLTATQGVLDPEGEDLLLPPLGTAQPTEGATEHSGASEEAAPTEGAS